MQRTLLLLRSTDTQLMLYYTITEITIKVEKRQSLKF